MKLLTKETDYAVRALLGLAKNRDSFISARKISKEQNIPYYFLRRILSKLINYNVVESREGSGGGFRITKDPALVGIKDLIKIFQGNIKLAECIFRKRLCQNRKTCALRKEIKRIEEIVESEFKGITLTKLLKS